MKPASLSEASSCVGGAKMTCTSPSSKGGNSGRRVRKRLEGDLVSLRRLRSVPVFRVLRDYQRVARHLALKKERAGAD